MNLRSLYINGFGKFHDFHLDELNPHMVILQGPNEAGKSTIMQFIRRILFGFPDKRSTTNLYPPLDGGKHGGSLTFSKIDGDYTVERYADEKNSLKVIHPDLSHQVVQNIIPLVGPINSEVFNNIFAFGLDELQNFESLNSESIKDQLYSAGKGLGHVSLKDFQKSLDKRMGELYKDKGSQPEINQLLRSITETTKKLHEIESESNRYKELQNELDGVNQSIEKKEQEKKQLKQQEHHTTILSDAWSDFRQIQEVEEQLREIPIVEQFPENGIVLMEKTLENKESLETGIRFKQEQIERLKRLMGELTIQGTLIENQEPILELQKRQEQYSKALEDLPVIRMQKESETEELNRKLREVGSDWNTENFETIDTSLPNKEKVKHFQEQFDSLQQSRQKKEQEKESLSKDLRRFSNELAENETALQQIETDFESPEEAMEQRKAVLYLEEMLSRHEEKKKEYTALLEKEAMQNQIKSLRRPALNSQLPLLLLLYGLVGLILGGSLYSIFSRNAVLAWFLGAIYLLVLFLFFSIRRQKKTIQETGETETREEYFTTQQKALEEELSEFKTKIQKTLQWIGFQSIPSKSELIARREMIQDNLAKMNKQLDIQTSQRKLHAMIENKEEEMKRWSEEMVALDEASRQNTEAWIAFLQRSKLDLGLTPMSVLQVFNALDTAKEKKKTIHNFQIRIEAMEETVQLFQERMSQLLRMIGMDRKNTDWLPVLERIIASLQDSRKNETELKSKQAEEKVLMEELQTMNDELKKVKGVIQTLLDQGKASDEQTFTANGEAFQRRNALLQDLAQYVHNIKRLTGEGTQYDLLVKELESSSYEVLIRNKDDLEEALKQCEEDIQDLRENKGRINKEIEQIEKREESSALRLAKSIYIEKANNLAREWATLVLAKSIMKKAIEEYEREKQPNVIKEAQHYFSLMTLGAYPSIYSPLNEDVLYVEDQNKRRKDIKDLSKGTAEQLYLSLRFGYIQEYAKNNEPLPIMMDDILVNFDPKRFDACCEALQSLSSTHQILYFTCHPDSATKMSQFIHSSSIVQLP